MNKIVLQVMGGFLVAFALAQVLMGILILRDWSVHLSLPPTMSPLTFCLGLLSFVMPLVAVGVGLLQLRKWAALALSMLGLYLAFWYCKFALYPVDPRPGDMNWVGFVFAFVFTLPSIATAKYWNDLVWRKK